MCLLIHQGGEGQLLSQTLGPNRYHFPAVKPQGQTRLQMHNDQWGEPYILQALCCPHQLFMTCTVCAVFGMWSWCSFFFFHPCAICMYSYVEEKRGWMGGGFKRPRGSYPFECCWFVPCCSVWPVLLRLLGIHAEWEVIRGYSVKLCIEMNTWRLADWKGFLGLTWAIQSYKSGGCLWVSLKFSILVVGTNL